MLDKKTAIALTVLNKLCQDETYKVIDFNTLINNFPKRLNMQKEQLDQSLEYLQTGEYIDLKYSENDTYCLTVLPKGRIILEDNGREKKTFSRFNQLLLLTTLTSGIMAFLGAFLAIMLFGWLRNMLNRKEKQVMKYLFEMCVGKKSCLIDPDDILNFLQPKYDVNNVELDQIVNALVLENYIDLVNSDKNGKLIYCISLKTKGEGFERECQNAKKNRYIIITRTVILACLSFAITLILKAIFSWLIMKLKCNMI